MSLSLNEKLEHLKLYPFHMPGHKRNSEFTIIGSSIDITEIEGFDNLHAPTGILKDLESEITSLFGSKKNFILVNGSTCGVLAAIFAVCERSDKILIARNCHKSVYNACELLELDMVFIEPEFDVEFGIYREISQASVKGILKKHPDAKALVLTSPTYEGVISEIDCPIPMIVDAAHGAHFGFADWLPPQPSGDIVIESLHKTLPALTQTAVIHVNNVTFIDRVKKYIDIFETSSPSYILLCGAEKCIEHLKSQADFSRLKSYLDDFYSLNLKHLKWIKADDITKINISTLNCNLSGTELAQKLREKGIEPEMAGQNHVILLSSIGDTKYGFELLKCALTEIDKHLTIKTKTPIRPILPKRACLIHEVSQTALTPLSDASNKICGEYIYAYPPGIPLLIPGEIISEEIIRQILEMMSSGISLISGSALLPHEILTKQ